MVLNYLDQQPAWNETPQEKLVYSEGSPDAPTHPSLCFPSHQSQPPLLTDSTSHRRGPAVTQRALMDPKPLAGLGLGSVFNLFLETYLICIPFEG